MNSRQQIASRSVGIVLVAGLLAAILFGPVWVPGDLGKRDFRAYWSAAHLLSRSQNFSDVSLLLETERLETGWNRDYALSTWNPPWLIALLLPYTTVSFTRAVWLWLWTNILLIFGGTVLAWHSYTRYRASKRWDILVPLLSFLYLPTLVALWMGQVNTLVFAGLAAFLFFEGRKQTLLAGTSLVLTLVKPHLVYITVPLLLLRALTKRDWRMLAGLLLGLVSLSGIVFLFRPTFITDYLQGVGGGSLLAWETPTLGGVLAASFGWQWAKLMGVVILPLALGVWWLRGRELKTPTLLNLTLLISVITAPFGWGYDAVVLLIPLLQVAAWLDSKVYGKRESAVLIGLVLIMNGVALRQRLDISSDLATFWIPIAVAIIFYLAYRRRAVPRGVAVSV